MGVSAHTPSLEVFKKRLDVPLRDMVSSHGDDGLGLDAVISELFSNVNGSVSLWLLYGIKHRLLMVGTLLVLWKAKSVSTQEAFTLENLFFHGFLSLDCCSSLLLSFSLLCLMFSAERKKHLLLPCLQLPGHSASYFFLGQIYTTS